MFSKVINRNDAYFPLNDSYAEHYQQTDKPSK